MLFPSRLGWALRQIEKRSWAQVWFGRKGINQARFRLGSRFFPCQYWLFKLFVSSLKGSAHLSKIYKILAGLGLGSARGPK